MKGVVGVNIWNVVIIGVVAVAAIVAYNKFLGGKTIAGVTAPQA